MDGLRLTPNKQRNTGDRMKISYLFCALLTLIALPVAGLPTNDVQGSSQQKRFLGTSGVEIGRGATKDEAYRDASANVSSDAQAQGPQYIKIGDDEWECSITWSKEDDE